MKLTVTQKELNNALNLVTKAIASRPSHPVLANVKLEAGDNVLTLTGFDLSMGMEITIPADSTETGVWTVPAKMFSDIVSRLPADQELGLALVEETLIINSGKSHFRLRGMDPEDYPELPTGSNVAWELPTELLRTGIEAVGYAASTDDFKQLLCGVNVQQTTDRLALAATDGHRLAVADLELTSADTANCTIPARAMIELDRWAGNNETIGICLSETNVQFTVPGKKLTCRTLDGHYPGYQQLIPNEFSRIVTADRQSLLATLNRLSVLTDPKNNLVKLQFGMESIICSTDGNEIGRGEEVVEAEMAGEPDAFAFNIRYLIDALKHLPGQQVKISSNQPNQPVILEPLTGQKQLQLIMPVQLTA